MWCGRRRGRALATILARLAGTATATALLTLVGRALTTAILTRLALIAYNAGPQHAREVRAGRAVAYRETRQYLAAIGARYPLP